MSVRTKVLRLLQRKMQSLISRNPSIRTSGGCWNEWAVDMTWSMNLRKTGIAPITDGHISYRFGSRMEIIFHTHG